MKTNRNIVIVGCGRLGSLLADRLSREGNAVVVVDRNEASFSRLSTDFSGFKVEGDATQLSVLERSRLKESDVLIATTHDDNVNIMVALVAQKVLRIPIVLARVLEPKFGQIYAQLGIKTICPTSIASEIFFQTVMENSSIEKGINL